MVAAGAVGARAMAAAAWIDETAVVGAGVQVHPSAVIGPGVVVGDGAVIGPGVVIENATLGERVMVEAGTVIGARGFGYLPRVEGVEGEGDAWTVYKPQELSVVVGDDVHLGANVTVDRGSWRETEIRSGSKLDNGVHVGHNVVIGEGTLIAAQSGIAGSCTIGRGVLLGGQVGIAQHLVVADGVRVAGKSGVLSDLLEAGAAYGGYPAVRIREFHRMHAMAKRGVERTGGGSE